MRIVSLTAMEIRVIMKNLIAYSSWHFTHKQRRERNLIRIVEILGKERQDIINYNEIPKIEC